MRPQEGLEAGPRHLSVAPVFPSSPCLSVLDIPADRALCRWALTLAATQACSAGAGRDRRNSEPLRSVVSP